jgi:hypothetical protein
MERHQLLTVYLQKAVEVSHCYGAKETQQREVGFPKARRRRANASRRFFPYKSEPGQARTAIGPGRGCLPHFICALIHCVMIQ